MRLLVELKTIITNYGQPGRPFMQSRDAIRADLRALGLRLDEHTHGAEVWLAYPITPERDDAWRVNHLRQIERDALTTRRITKINVGQEYVSATSARLALPLPGLQHETRLGVRGNNSESYVLDTLSPLTTIRLD